MTIRSRALLGLVVAVAVSAILTGTLASRTIRERTERRIVRELEQEARLVALGIAAAPANLNLAAHRHGAVLGRRVTLIDEGGTVVGDSDFDDRSLALLDNHLNRPEIRAALERGVGIARRYSASTNRDELKVAVAAWPGVVRISEPMRSVDAAVPGVAGPIVAGALAALLVGGVYVLWLAWSITAPLQAIVRSSRADDLLPVAPHTDLPEVASVMVAYRSLGDRMRERLRVLTSEREQTRTVIDALAEGVLAADAGGRIIHINRAAREFLGLPPDEPPPPLDELFHEAQARSVVKQVRGGQTTTGGEVEFRGRSLLITGRPLPRGGAVLGFIDMSESRRLQAIRRDFVANVSHELKTPLTSILGYAETLLAGGEDDAVRHQFLGVIRDNARRMQRLVDDLLDLARVESGAWSPDAIALGLAAVAREAWSALGDRPDRSGVRLVCDVSEDVPVLADHDAAHTIFANLFDNAVRHTPAGGTVTVAAAPSGSMVLVTVADTGSGIGAEHIPRLFERFYRVDPGRSREEGGTGLGLSIVRHLVEAHGGRVRIESRIGKGTTVQLTLPAPTLSV